MIAHLYTTHSFSFFIFLFDLFKMNSTEEILSHNCDFVTLYHTANIVLNYALKCHLSIAVFLL